MTVDSVSVGLDEKVLRISDIIDEKPYREFIETLKTEETRITYNKILLKFMKARSFKSTQQMLDLSDDEVEEMIEAHLLALREAKLSYSTVNQNFCVLKHFYTMNSRRLNDKKLARYVGEFQLMYELEAYTTDEIRAILANCDLRMKVAVLTLATTGMRIGALARLELRHLKKIDKYGLYQFTIYKNTREHTVCFCTPECAAVIDQYLDYRKRAGEQLLPNSEHPFIREQFDANDLQQVRENARHVSVSTHTNILQAILVKAGLKKINHNSPKGLRHSKPINHAFRYWWMNEAMRTRMNPEIRKRLYSHDTGNLERRYWKNLNAEPELLDEYVRCVNKGAFAISEEFSLRQKVQILEGEKSRFDNLAANQQDLNNQMKEVREFIKNFPDLYMKGKIGKNK